MALPVDGKQRLKVQFKGKKWGMKIDKTVEFEIQLLRGHVVPFGDTIKDVPVIGSLEYFVLEGELEGELVVEVIP